MSAPSITVLTPAGTSTPLLQQEKALQSYLPPYASGNSLTITNATGATLGYALTLQGTPYPAPSSITAGATVTLTFANLMQVNASFSQGASPYSAVVAGQRFYAQAQYPYGAPLGIVQTPANTFNITEYFTVDAARSFGDISSEDITFNALLGTTPVGSYVVRPGNARNIYFRYLTLGLIDGGASTFTRSLLLTSLIKGARSLTVYADSVALSMFSSTSEVVLVDTSTGDLDGGDNQIDNDWDVDFD